MIGVTVAHLGLDRTTNTPVVILREKDGSRVLPIWIGPAEASAIAMELQGMKAQRPLTHDLLKQVLIGLGGDLRRVVISTVKENTYFAELMIRREDHVFQVDARPSDSIALALRMQKMRQHRATLVNQRGVGGEDQIGTAFDRRERRDLRAELLQDVAQAAPLHACQLAIGLLGAVHPGIDFVLNPIEVRRTHQDMRRLHDDFGAESGRRRRRWLRVKRVGIFG